MRMPTSRLAAGRVAAVPALFLAASIVMAATEAPAPVAERTVTLGGRTIRLTLFDNRVAVVSIRQGASAPWLNKVTLDEDEYIGYLASITLFLDTVATAGRQELRGYDGADAHITLHAGTGAPRQVDYRPGMVLDLATARLVAGLDDLELKVTETLPAQEALREWEPRVGDRVELHTGRRARIRQVHENGVIVVEHETEALVEMVPIEERGLVIRRLITEEE